MMIKVWFLMALMAYPDSPAIHYKGYGGFLEKEECEERIIMTENMIVESEMNKGKTVLYVEAYCMEFEGFESSLEIKKELDKLRNKKNKNDIKA
jgi:hypothetical protein